MERREKERRRGPRIHRGRRSRETDGPNERVTRKKKGPLDTEWYGTEKAGEEARRVKCRKEIRSATGQEKAAR